MPAWNEAKDADRVAVLLGNELDCGIAATCAECRFWKPLQKIGQGRTAGACGLETADPEHAPYSSDDACCEFWCGR